MRERSDGEERKGREGIEVKGTEHEGELMNKSMARDQYRYGRVRRKRKTTDRGKRKRRTKKGKELDEIYS